MGTNWICIKQPRHLDVAHKLIRKTMGGERYGGRAQFSQNDKRPRPNSFEDGLSFLNYESLLTQHSAQDEEDDIESVIDNVILPFSKPPALPV